ncbi:kinase-like protein, partial [Cubamyces sp. BRFM 1775]
VERELAALEHLNSLPYSTHLGRQCIRTCLDHFELPAEHIGKPYPFQCFVFKPTTVSVWRVRQGLGGRLPVDLVKSALRHVLCGLAYLHQEANMVHTDIQEENILITLDDPGALAAFEEAEWTSPLPQKHAGDRTIYLSRPILSKNLKSSHPVLTDFGEARFGRASYMGPIQPEPYRAPEVILGMPWNEKADIWSVGVMAWHMLQGREMFQVPDELDEEGRMRHHMAHVVSLLGPPPVDFLERSETEEPGKYFDAQGECTRLSVIRPIFRNWIGTVDLPKSSLELSEQMLEGENKAQFLRFIRKMVAWRPEDRSPAHELSEDPWVRV